MVKTVEDLNLDGIDLVQEQSYGTANMNANDETSIHLYILSLLRESLPDKLLTYTFPGDGGLVFPFRDVAQYGHKYLNTINVFRATPQIILDLQATLGVPREKVKIQNQFFVKPQT
jgi:hypothetical protein